MRHEAGCDCEHCVPTAKSDTVLVGMVIILGVLLALTTASRIVVAIAISTAVLLVALKLRHAMIRVGRKPVE